MPRKKKKKLSKGNVIATIIVLLLVVIGYFYISDVKQTEKIENTPRSTPANPYQLLENKDSSLVANIILEYNTSILQLSKIFYKNEIFWPYIFQANGEKIGNILNLESGTIVKIPKVTPPRLLDANNKETVKYIKHLGDSILDKVTEDRKSLLEYNEDEL